MAETRQSVELRSAYTRTIVPIELVSDTVYLIGHNAKNDIVLEGSDLQPFHAKVSIDIDKVRIEAVNNAPIAVNGTPIDGPAGIVDGDWIALGQALFQLRYSGAAKVTEADRKSEATDATELLSTDMPASQVSRPQEGKTVLMASRTAGQHPGAKANTSLSLTERIARIRAGDATAAQVTIGRQAGVALQIDSPLVSREHARLHLDDQGVALEDLGSTNGTFVNGVRLEHRQRLNPGDRIGVAAFAFVFTGESLQAVDLSGSVRVEVRKLTKAVPDRATRGVKKLLDDISLVIEPGEFVVLFGTSGSGKSTLLDALNGRRPATDGHVYYNDTDLYSAFDMFRATIGYVPQQDIVHRKINVRNALHYTARLRLPPDTTSAEIQQYSDSVLNKVGLAEKAGLAIDTPAPLSGGQLKRVSLAVELVANPTILFMDEVTSGLDAGTDKRMMQLFAALAADHKTVICVTHTLENIDTCHLVVLLHQGKLVYFGPPASAAEHFGVTRLTEVYELLDSAPAETWAAKYAESDLHRIYVRERLTDSLDPLQSDPQSSNVSKPVATPAHGRQSWWDWRQAFTLTRRYLDLILSDRRNLLILLLQAPVIAVTIGSVFKLDGEVPVRAGAEVQIAFLLVISAIWFGTLNSARELVKELPIYLRERSVNLQLGPYLFSKLVPLAILCFVQCLLLMGIVKAMLPLEGQFLWQVICLFSASMAATGMGLAVSAFVDTNDKAIAMAPILLIPQIVLANALVHLAGLRLWVAKTTMIAFWTLDALKSTLGEVSRSAKDISGELIVPVLYDYATSIGMNCVLGATFLTVAIIGLKLKDRRS